MKPHLRPASSGSVLGTLGLAFFLAFATPASADELPCTVRTEICRRLDPTNWLWVEREILSYECTSSSRQVLLERGETATTLPVWETEIRARLSDGSDVYAATLVTLGPPGDGLFEEGVERARDAIRVARGAPGPVPDAVRVGRTTATVYGLRFADVRRRRTLVSVLEARVSCSPSPVQFCVGDVGVRDVAPLEAVRAPCPVEASPVDLRCTACWGPADEALCADELVTTHTHTLTTVFENVVLTGELVTERWEVVDFPHGPPVRWAPGFARPRAVVP